MAEEKVSFFDKQFAQPEVQKTESTEGKVNESVETPNTPETPKSEPTLKGTEGVKKEEVKAEAPKSNWWEEANKIFKTEFKSPEDLGKHIERSKKADELEPKVTEYESKVKKYEEQLKELQSSLNPLSYFRDESSYVAEQLRRQHPDKSPTVLQEIVTKGNSGMSDLDVLIKNELLNNPDLIGGEQGAKEIVYDRYQIDQTVPIEEWSTLTQNKIRVEAKTARKAWDELKGTVQIPKVATPEEREAERVRLQEERQKAITPLRETFSKFDKFTEPIDDDYTVDFTVPDEYKESLPAMFNTYFVEAGLEPTRENLQSIEDLKKGMMLLKHFKQIAQVIRGDALTKAKAEQDKLLGNENPSNTKSGKEVNKGEDDINKWNRENGLGKLLKM